MILASTLLQPEPLFDINFGLLRSRPLFVIPLVEVIDFLKTLYPKKVSVFDSISQESFPLQHYIVCGNHRFSAGISLGIDEFYVHVLTAKSLIDGMSTMTAIILRELENTDNILETKPSQW